jgi:hypothetical protein
MQVVGIVVLIVPQIHVFASHRMNGWTHLLATLHDTHADHAGTAAISKIGYRVFFLTGAYFNMLFHCFNSHNAETALKTT